MDQIIEENEVLDVTVIADKTDKEVINITDNRKWIAFMCHLAHTEFENLIQEVEKLEAPYIVSAEVGNYEHFHFLVKITERQYNTFVTRVFYKKYRLRGKAMNGLPRQYGKVKEVNDLSKMMAYTIKDKNFRTNMKTEDIEHILKKKITEVINSKKETREIKEKMIDFVNDRMPNYMSNQMFRRHEKYIRIAIIDFMIENKINIMRTTIERYYWYYVAYTTNDNYKLSSTEIYQEIYDALYSG